jgi:hypothetical protein
MIHFLATTREAVFFNSLRQWLSQRSRRVTLLAIMLASALLAGCAGPDPMLYKGQTPALDLKSYFNGKITGWGMVQGRNGQVERRFVVRIDASWTGDEGILDEHFEWSDGEKQRRVWRIRSVGPGRYVGRADDVAGEAIGEVFGNALRWRYTLNVPFRGSTIGLDFDDWMLLIDDRVMLNRAVFSKWGIRLGEVTLSFSK